MIVHSKRKFLRLARQHCVQTVLFTGCFVLSSVLMGCGGGGVKSETKVVKKESKEKEKGGSSKKATTSTSSAKANTFGTLKGRVVLKGTAPTLAPLTGIKKDPEVCAANPIPDERLVVGKENGVANVFVYLSKTPKGWDVPENPAEAAIFDQKGCVFIPHCLVLRTNQELKVLSDDPIAHNTHTFPKRNTGESKLVKGGDREGVPFVYKAAETSPFEVKCDYHTWMIAYHLPLDHPWAVVTDADGNFEIPNFPAGSHSLTVWHEAASGGGYVQRGFKVDVKGGSEPTVVEIEYDVGKANVAGIQNLKTMTVSQLQSPIK